MLNINQNFDLKAPVFNFDRDYFNSVEELEAYDTSNVPDHFVTNVGGMLYQFTKGKWFPMVGTDYSGANIHDINFGGENAKLRISNGFPESMSFYGEDDSSIELRPDGLTVDSGLNSGNVTINANYDGGTAGITVSGNGDAITLVENNQIVCGDDIFDVTIYGDEGRVEINDAQNRTTNYASFGFQGQTKDDTRSYSLSIPSDDDTDSDVSLSLKHEDYSTKLSTGSGLTITSNEGFATNIDNQSFSVQVFDNPAVTLDSDKLLFYKNGNTTALKLSSSDGLVLGNDDKVKLSRPTNDGGGVISGIKSLTSFSNPSATKVWATDGSTVDLSTKANTSDLDAKANASDVLLKKSESGGYYIEENSNKLGSKAFATNSTCSASGVESHAEGHSTRTTGGYSHAEGWQTLASGICSHTEGEYNEANGYCSHAQGSYNVSAKDVIHSVGIGTIAVRKNAEYIYAKNNTNGSALADDPKNGYKYLIGVGGYDGISTDNTTYKSVQEVIADLTARIEQLETKVKALEDANTPA